ncbi:MAG: inositol phosphorylceramide synthase [Myxococcaceae bacterium]|nr:inositol phosphorylceramide synthase [Myxococcaceae bacterium]
MRRGHLLQRIRPAEWVALIFLTWLGAQIAVRGLTVGDGELRRFDLFAALMVVVFARQVLRFRALRWPEEARAFARAHWVLLPIVLVPLALDVVTVIRLPAGAFSLDQGGALAAGLRAIWWLWRRFALAGLPLVLVWLAAGIHVKQHGGLNARVFLAESAKGIGRAVRDWAPLLTLLFSYGILGAVLDRPESEDKDALLSAIDRALFFGHDPVLALQAIINRPLSEWLTFAYTFYGPIFPLCFGLFYFREDPRAFRELTFAICFALAVGFFCYTIVPAQGPVFTQHFTVDLGDYYSRWMKENLMDRLRVPRDCFPSLHTATTLIFLLEARRHAKRLFWFLLPIVASIPFACVYLRYHYVIDVIVGVPLALGAVWLARRLYAVSGAPVRTAWTS